ncbi:putative NRPS-like protein biosynthetic cluster [Penicillium ochrochloron]
MNALLKKIAGERPSYLAIEDGEHSLSYDDLLRRADNLAHTLEKYPLNPEEPIGILFGPSIETVIAQVALLRMGLTSVPLDPSVPEIRMREMLDDIKSRFVIAPPTMEGLGLEVIPIPDDRPSHSYDSSSSRGLGAKEPNRSHILYTSGSTGKPKAVQITSESLLCLATSTSITPLKSGDRVALINNPGFDISLFEIWAPLLSGGTIVVVPRHVVIDPFAFRDFAVERKMDVVFLTASLFNAIALAIPTAFQTVREVLTAGEVASPLAMRTVLESGGAPAHLWNTYGPTETTTFSTTQLVTVEEAQRDRVGIGRPSGDLLFLLDENLDPVTTDATPAEIYIGGPGLSSGYLGRPEETKAQFIEIAGSRLGIDDRKTIRLYRTGDLAEWRDYSTRILDFIGRVDRQVKQGGFRIELEEVEQTLVTTDWFTAVIVQQMRKEEQSEPFLVAFVTSRVTGVPKRRVLDWASQRMPHYMVPRDIVFCSKFPLTSSNKVDLKAMRKMYWDKYQSSHDKASEGKGDTRLISLLRDLWSSLLGVPTVKDDDNFFRLGGTSIMSAKMISKLRIQIGKTVPMRALYENSRFVDFAAYLDEFAEGTVATHQYERWKRDASIADSLEIIPGDTPNWLAENEGRVLMTGVTGFVGVNFLARLLRHPNVEEVVSIVRGKNNTSPRLRVEQVLKRYNLWNYCSSYFRKLTVLEGDISKDKLGLSQEKFDWLASWASAVFHLAAKVNFCEPYEAHFESNVLGTRNAIELAVNGRRKSFHFTSSIDAWGPNGLILGTKKCLEDDSLEPSLKGLPYDIGYAASKWASEQIVRRARDRGLPAAIYRPGFVIGDSKTGAGNPDDFFARLMVGSIQIGSFPCLPNQRMEYVTVDYVCDAMLHIASRNDNLGRSYSLVAPDPALSVNLVDTVKVINDAGYSVRMVPYSKWVKQLHDPNNKDNSLMPLMPLLQEKVWGELTRFETSRNTPHYDATNAIASLADAPDIEYIPLTPEQLNRFLSFWNEKGFYHV